MPVNRRGLVTSVGIDTAESLYRFSVGVVDPVHLSPPGGKGSPSQQPTVFVYTATAPNLDQAMHNLSSEMQYHMDLNHLKIIIVSEEVARHGLMPVIDYFARSPDAHETPWLFVGRGASAQSFIESGRMMNPDEGATLDSTAEWTNMHLPYHSIRMYAFERDLGREGATAILTGLFAAPAPSPGHPHYSIQGTAAFRHDRLKGFLSPEASYGLAVATGHTPHFAMTFAQPTARGRFTVDVISSRSKLSLTHIQSSPALVLDARVKAYITSMTPEKVLLTPSDIAPFRQAVANELLKDLEALVLDSQRLQVDPAAFGEHIRVFHPDVWRQWETAWLDRIYPQMPVAVHVSVTFTSVGNKVIPLGQTEAG